MPAHKISMDMKLRVVRAVKLGMTGQDVADYAGVPLIHLRKWLREGELATKGKKRDLYRAVQRARADFRVNIQAGLIKAAQEGNVRAHELLLETGRNVDLCQSPAERLYDAIESIDLSVLDGLSDTQQYAARLLVSGTRYTNQQLADTLGIPLGTLLTWKRDHRFIAALQNLRAQIHKLTMTAIVRGATTGVLAQEEALHRLRLEMLRASAPEDVVRLSRAINAIATSLQDRGGYPKTERTEIAQPAEDPRPHKDMSTDDIRAQLRLLEGRS